MPDHLESWATVGAEGRVEVVTSIDVAWDPFSLRAN